MTMALMLTMTMTVRSHFGSMFCRVAQDLRGSAGCRCMDTVESSWGDSGDEDDVAQDHDAGGSARLAGDLDRQV